MDKYLLVLTMLKQLRLLSQHWLDYFPHSLDCVIRQSHDVVVCCVNAAPNKMDTLRGVSEAFFLDGATGKSIQNNFSLKFKAIAKLINFLQFDQANWEQNFPQ